ncbi:MerR family transcriptional regulator [Microbacterium sp. NPDC058342]|uniref:MerR family transcriptional regulator n=1 Tax=Microbacterium sp. NPDC058342 TaxID=3346454 RepID=UPI003662BA21
MVKDALAPEPDRYTTSRLAAATGYSVQQVRDLERLGVIPPARRQFNGYREFNPVHVIALRAYRRLAIAVGPVAARSTMRDIQGVPHDEAVARIIAVHVDLARSRAAVLSALSALDSIVEEGVQEAAPVAEDAMTITQLSTALGVRSSTLRFWEQQGLLAPERSPHHGARIYPPDAVRDARIVTALRAGGYRIPAVHAAIASLRSVHEAGSVREALQDRLRNIAEQSEALLLAGNALVVLLRSPATGTEPGRDLS